MKRILLVLVPMGLAFASCSPGVVDGTESIAQGYFLADTGGNGRTIEYHDARRAPRTVIGARVETYSKQGAVIVVARRPALVVMKDGSAEWQVSPACEYWIIDTTTHAVRVTTDALEYDIVRCRY